jgi:hypothetical protein
MALRAQDWFLEQGLDPESITFMLYEDPALVKQPGAKILVGGGNEPSGANVGFVIELKQTEGVLESKLFRERSGVTIHHKTIARMAKQQGKKFIDMATELANSN